MIRAWPAAALAIMLTGGLWIALWRQTWRWLGLVPIAASILMILSATPPDVLIARNLKSAAIRGEDGKLVIVGTTPDGYTASQWLTRDGDRRDMQLARSSSHCDQQSCVAVGKQGRVLALPVTVSALPDDCARASIVVSGMPLHGHCPGPELLIDGSDIARNGAMAITFVGDRSVVETVRADRGTRPWSNGQ
jgi:competence protein ComEC